MSRRVSVVMNSGVLLINDKENHYPSLDIGFFDPHINIYVDGEFLEEVKTGSSKTLDFRHVESDGKATSDGVHLTGTLVSSLLRWTALFGGATPPKLITEKLPTIINLNSGRMHDSMLLERRFYAMRFPEFKGERVDRGTIPHALVTEYDLLDNQKFELLGDGATIWPASQFPEIKKVLQIEVVTYSSTVYQFYRDCLNLDQGDLYFLPNQGFPPPVGGP